MNDHEMADMRPEGCCGVCPSVVGGGYDCTCADNPRCPNTDPVTLARKWDESDLSDVGLMDLMDLAKRLADKVERLRDERDKALAAIERVRDLADAHGYTPNWTSTGAEVADDITAALDGEG